MVLSVSEQENRLAVANYIAKYGLEYPFALDVTGEVGRTYNLFTTPTTYFINPDGIIEEILPGTVTKAWLESNLVALES